VLTGTDLYRDIDDDAAAQASLALADRLVVLQALGPERLAPALRAKTVVCVQSSPPRAPLPNTTRRLRALMVGHLRAEKESADLLRCRAHPARPRRPPPRPRRRRPRPRARPRSRADRRRLPHYRWLGALPHGATRRRVRAAHVLAHPSRMEGGAQVVIEAVMSGTPVLASRIDGNVGLLGERYDGYFPCGDAAALAALLARCRDVPAMLDGLTRQCAERAPLFAPERERATLRTLLADLLKDRR